ncbi:MAG TPA: hypothetical protein DEF82_02735 [Crocinitomicaceae bacterium]|nr:hypothetical protein [Flavobacteriales bacterium]HBW85677.1 hypothetical protein [Crocinitomicaceae bacterium]
MTKEGRVAFLALLSVGLYTLSLFISYQKILFPFPLFDPILWVVTLSVFIIQYQKKSIKEQGFGAYFFLFYVQLKLICNPFVMSFFIDFNETESYFENPMIQLSKLIAQTILSLALICWFIVGAKRKYFWTLIITALAIIVQFNFFMFSHLLFCSILVIPFFILKPENPWKNVLLVHGIFDLITLYYLVR